MPAAHPNANDIKNLLADAIPRARRTSWKRASVNWGTAIALISSGMLLDEVGRYTWRQGSIDVREQVELQAMIWRASEMTGETRPEVWARYMEEVGVRVSSQLTHAQFKAVATHMADDLVVAGGPNLIPPSRK